MSIINNRKIILIPKVFFNIKYLKRFHNKQVDYITINFSLFDFEVEFPCSVSKIINAHSS